MEGRNNEAGSAPVIGSQPGQLQDVSFCTARLSWEIQKRTLLNSDSFSAKSGVCLRGMGHQREDLSGCWGGLAAWPRGGASSTSVGPVASSRPSGAAGDTEVESPGSRIDLERQKARPRDEVR